MKRMQSSNEHTKNKYTDKEGIFADHHASQHSPDSAVRKCKKCFPKLNKGTWI